MYASIVVGTDGSATAEAALEKALALGKLSAARVHVVSAYEPARTRVTGDAPASEAYVAPDYKADVALQRALGRAGAQSVEVEQHAPRGDPADALLAVAKEQGADLIVIGSVGMQGARRVLGSVPNKVSHRSSCDVLIVQTTG